MNQNWRSPVVEHHTAKSDSDDDDKTLVDEDEERLNAVELDKLYVLIPNPLEWENADDSRRMQFQQLLKWL